MKYIRTVPGRVYEDQLYKMLSLFCCKSIVEEVYASSLSLSDYLNLNNPIGILKQFLKMDPMTKG